MAAAGSEPLFEVRKSKVHGKGAFALKRIAKGTRIVEYLGERISHEEADRRYEGRDPDDNHTFLFIVDKRTVIDAGVHGNDARFINHSCDPNCETSIEEGHIFIDAIRSIARGEELTYDYQIVREARDPPDIDEIFACKCGAASCRGTMLWPPRREQRAPRREKSAAAAPAKPVATGKKRGAQDRARAAGPRR
jgi:SET domain-containing protein